MFEIRTALWDAKELELFGLFHTDLMAYRARSAGAPIVVEPAPAPDEPAAAPCGEDVAAPEDITPARLQAALNGFLARNNSDVAKARALLDKFGLKRLGDAEAFHQNARRDLLRALEA